MGTIALMVVIIPVSLFVGLCSAIYLEEYAKKNKFTTFIQMNISNLAGVPSVVFGLLGLTVFSRMMGLGNSILAAGFTMSLLILPIIIVASQEAISAVPESFERSIIRNGCYQMANNHQRDLTVFNWLYPYGKYSCVLTCNW